jgi:hypothetical protein
MVVKDMSREVSLVPSSILLSSDAEEGLFLGCMAGSRTGVEAAIC